MRINTIKYKQFGLPRFIDEVRFYYSDLVYPEGYNIRWFSHLFIHLLVFCLIFWLCKVGKARLDWSSIPFLKSDGKDTPQVNIFLFTENWFGEELRQNFAPDNTPDSNPSDTEETVQDTDWEELKQLADECESLSELNEKIEKKRS